MDYILLAFCSLFFVKGLFKGFVSTVFSFIGTCTVAIVAWKLSEWGAGLFQSQFGNGVTQFISDAIDKKIFGSFSSVKALQLAISQQMGMVGVLLFKILGSIQFDGELSAGQILAPTISNLLFRIVAFLILFIGMLIILKIVKKLLNKLIKLCGFGVGNRVLGGVVGLAQGVILSGIVFVCLSTLANVLMNEGLLNFVNSGAVSCFLYTQGLQLLQ